MKIETRIELGDKVIDTINGHKGTASCVQLSLSGCVQFLVESDVTKDNPKGVDWWIDEQRLKITKKSKFVPEASKAKIGGQSRMSCK